MHVYDHCFQSQSRRADELKSRIHVRKQNDTSTSRFSEKLTVAFTSSTVFIIDYITKPVWSHVVASSARTLNKAHIVSCQEASAQITK